MGVLEALLEREKGLRSCWNLQTLIGDGAHEEDDCESGDVGRQKKPTVNVAGVFKQADACVTSAMFWSYTRFLLSIHGALNKISTWAEACPCHPIDKPCPLKGRRCNELADGCFDRFLEKVSRKAKADFLAAAAGLPAKEMCILQQDFIISSDLIFSEARLKTSHWHSLPWALCGVASDSEKSGRAAAMLVSIHTELNFSRAE